jgi:hypothetical protein
MKPPYFSDSCTFSLFHILSLQTTVFPLMQNRRYRRGQNRADGLILAGRCAHREQRTGRSSSDSGHGTEKLEVFLGMEGMALGLGVNSPAKKGNQAVIDTTGAIAASEDLLQIDFLVGKKTAPQASISCQAQTVA